MLRPITFITLSIAAAGCGSLGLDPLAPTSDASQPMGWADADRSAPDSNDDDAAGVAGVSAERPGLDPFVPGEDFVPPEIEHEPAASLTGATFLLDLAYGEMVHPMALADVFSGNDVRPMLLNVVHQDARWLSMAVAPADADGAQDTCADVALLPEGQLEDGSHLVVAGPHLDMEIDGYAVGLSDVEISGHIDADASRWTDGTLLAVIDMRDLLGTVLKPDAPVCDEDARRGFKCYACADGELVCATIEIEFEATRVSTDFDPTVDTEDCE